MYDMHILHNYRHHLPPCGVVRWFVYLFMTLCVIFRSHLQVLEVFHKPRGRLRERGVNQMTILQHNPY